MRKIPVPEKIRIETLLELIQRQNNHGVGEQLVALKQALDRLPDNLVSDYKTQLTKIKEKLSKQTAPALIEIPSPDFTLPKRDYFGSIGKDANDHVEVKAFFGNAILSQSFGPIRFSWRFNPWGKIMLLDSMTFPDNRIRSIISIPDEKKRDKDYDSINATTYCLPRLSRSILETEVDENAYLEQLEFILQKGHELAGRTIYAAASDSLSDSRHRRKQHPLTEILSDGAALTILEYASRHRPAVEAKNLPRATIKYQ